MVSHFAGLRTVEIARLVTATKGPDPKDPEKQSPAVEWRHNALWHSFCSYRLADVRRAAQVAPQAGNNPQMIFQQYRELVTEKRARAWFAITPATAKEVREKIDRERAAKIVAFAAVVAA